MLDQFILEKEYCITSNLHRTLHDEGRLTPDQKNEVYLQLNHYIEEYKTAIKSYDLPSVLYSFYLEIDKQYKNDKTSCKKGCSFCCHIHVDISEDEAKFIKMLISEMNINIDKERLEKQKDHVAESWRQLKALDRRCVLLNDNHECSIYEYRPAVCRNYHVISDPSECDLDNPNEDKVMKLSAVIGEIITSAIITASKSDTMAKQLLSC